MQTKIQSYGFSPTHMQATVPSNLLDESSLAVVRSSRFIDEVNRFLRKVHRVSDTTIRISNDTRLQAYANLFCKQLLDKYFPNIWTTEVPNPKLVYGEVLWQYRNLKAELLNKARLKPRLVPVCLSEPLMPPEWHQSVLSSPPCLSNSIMPPEAHQSIMPQGSHQSIPLSPSCLSKSITPPELGQPILPSPPAASTVSRPLSRSPEISKRRRIRNQCRKARKKVQKDNEAAPQPIMNETLDTVIEEAEGALADESCPLPSIPSSQNSSTSSDILTSSQLSHHSIIRKITPAQLVSQFKTVKEANSTLKAELEHLKAENKHLTSANKRLNDYRTFVSLTLRVCQDTYLAEEQSAKAIKLYRQVEKCNVVVEALRDLLSDVDPDYFNDYHLLHDRAPPSRFWLDGVRRSRQCHEILRS